MALSLGRCLVLFPLATTLLFWLALIHVLTDAIDPVVQVTSPAHPIRSGGMLSVRCQIWHMDDTYDVTLSRQLKGDTKSKSIAWNHDVLSSVDDRVFLAIRPLHDASVVYFLSIIDISREDAGEYSCKVISMLNTLREVAVDSVNIDVLFFPSDSFPNCHHQSNDNTLIVYAGSKLSLNCSSSAGNPIVTLKWSRTGPGSLPAGEMEQTTTNGMTYSIITLHPIVADSGAMFICRATSIAFPKISHSCNIGPIIVRPSTMPSSTPNPYDVVKSRSTLRIPDLWPSSGTPKDVIIVPPKFGSNARLNCKDSCSMWNSAVSYWFLATAVAGVSAFIFFVIGVALMVKVCRIPGIRARTARPIYGCAAEDIYVDLDERVLEANRVYMTLEKPAKTVLEPDGTYTRTPVIIPRIH